MSSLNPFTAQRKKREEKLEEKLSELRALQETPPAAMGGSAGGAPAPFFSPAFTQKETDYEAEDFSKYLPASAQVEQSAPAWQASAGKYYEPPSRARQCFSKIQSAFMIGGALGGAAGFLYGSLAGRSASSSAVGRSSAATSASPRRSPTTGESSQRGSSSGNAHRCGACELHVVVMARRGCGGSLRRWTALGQGIRQGN
eukprot:scaffold20591_cov132-Isochrysis_galbana.AAC.3